MKSIKISDDIHSDLKKISLKKGMSMDGVLRKLFVGENHQIEKTKPPGRNTIQKRDTTLSTPPNEEIDKAEKTELGGGKTAPEAIFSNEKTGKAENEENRQSKDEEKEIPDIQQKVEPGNSKVLPSRGGNEAPKAQPPNHSIQLGLEKTLLPGNYIKPQQTIPTVNPGENKEASMPPEVDENRIVEKVVTALKQRESQDNFGKVLSDVVERIKGLENRSFEKPPSSPEVKPQATQVKLPEDVTTALKTLPEFQKELAKFGETCNSLNECVVKLSEITKKSKEEIKTQPADKKPEASPKAPEPSTILRYGDTRVEVAPGVKVLKDEQVMQMVLDGQGNLLDMIATEEEVVDRVVSKIGGEKVGELFKKLKPEEKAGVIRGECTGPECELVLTELDKQGVRPWVKDKNRYDPALKVWDKRGIL